MRSLKVMGLAVWMVACGLGRPSWAQVVVSPAPPAAAPPSTTVVTQPPAQPPSTTVVTTPTQAPPPATVVTQPPAAPPTVVVAGSGHEGRRRYGLIGGGIALFAVPYLVTVIAAAVTSDVCQADSSLGCTSARWPIYIPVVGPFIQMGYVNGTGSNTARAMLGIDGALQAGGVAMFITGVVLRASSPREAQARWIQFAPYTPPGGAGLLAMGRF